MKTNARTLLILVPLILAATGSLLLFGVFRPDLVETLLPFSMTGNAFVDGKLKYQFVTLAVALALLAVTFLLEGKNSKMFYRAGKLDAPAEPLGWMGIKSNDTWKGVGINFAVIVSIATAVFVYLNVFRGQTLEPQHVRFLPIVLVLAVMNAFTEEAITRLSVVTALHGKLSNEAITIASGLLFGIPHYFGVPGGIIGSLMAGFLGWLLAKSILETKGFAWAWFIHFLQDVIIITAMFWAAL
jgi:membrane protease YdiL (CAAX protease family)